MFYAYRSLNNKFEGSIPPSLGGIPDLYLFDLANNLLTGDLPVFNGTDPGLDNWQMQCTCKSFHDISLDVWRFCNSSVMVWWICTLLFLSQPLVREWSVRLHTVPDFQVRNASQYICKADDLEFLKSSLSRFFLWRWDIVVLFILCDQSAWQQQILR